jgi:hypothetical protein
MERAMIPSNILAPCLFTVCAAVAGPCFGAPEALQPQLAGGSGSNTKDADDEKAAQQKCPSLQTLDRDAATTAGDTDRLVKRLDTLGHRLRTVSELLAIPSDLAKDLKKIETLLAAVQKGAQLAEAVPQLEAQAKKVKEAIPPALLQVQSARTKAAALGAKLEPARQLTSLMATGSTRTALGLDVFSKDVLKQMPKVSLAAQYSIVHFEDPTRTCIQAKVDDCAGRLDEVVLGLDKVVLALLVTFGIDAPVLKDLENFVSRLDALDAVRKKAAQLEARLAGMERELKALEHLLDSTYTVKIPYLLGHYDVKINMSRILKGSKVIEDEIKDAVSGAVWDAAKAFGLEKLIKDVEKDAFKDLDEITGKLHLNPDLAIPGLGQLDDWMAPADAFLAVFPGTFRIPTFTMDAPDFGLPQVPASLDLRNLVTFSRVLSPLGFTWEWPKLIALAPALGCK